MSFKIDKIIGNSPDAGAGSTTPVSIENPLGFVYITGDADTDGSRRFSINSSNGFALIERRTDGVWQPASLETGSGSVWVGMRVGIGAAGHHIITEDSDGHAHFHAHAKFDGETSISNARIIDAWQYTAREIIQADNSGSFTGTEFSHVLPVTAHNLMHTAYLQTHTTPAGDTVRLRMWEGTDDTGTQIFDQKYPAAQFPASTEIQLEAVGYVEFESASNYFIKITSPSNFSLKTNAAVTFPWLAANVSDVHEDDILQTTEWVSGDTFALGQWSAQDKKVYVCNVAGVQTGTFASNSAKWDLLGSFVTGDFEATGNASIGGDVHVGGDVIVDGTITSQSTENLLVTDSHILLNNGYQTVAAKTGGVVVNYLPTTTADTVSSGAFVAGIAATSNPTVATVGAATFSQNDLIMINASADNDGLYEVHSHAANILTVRGIGTVATDEGFTGNQFIVAASDNATITKVNVSVLCSDDDGEWRQGKGAVTPITFVDVGDDLWEISGDTLQNLSGPTQFTFNDGTTDRIDINGNTFIRSSTGNSTLSLYSDGGSAIQDATRARLNIHNSITQLFSQTGASQLNLNGGLAEFLGTIFRFNDGTSNRIEFTGSTSYLRSPDGAKYFQLDDTTTGLIRNGRFAFRSIADSTWIRDVGTNAQIILENGFTFSRDYTVYQIKADATDTRLVSPDENNNVIVSNAGVSIAGMQDLDLSGSLYQPVFGDETGLINEVPFNQYGSHVDQLDKATGAVITATGSNIVTSADNGRLGAGMYVASGGYYSIPTDNIPTGSDPWSIEMQLKRSGSSSKRCFFTFGKNTALEGVEFSNNGNDLTINYVSGTSTVTDFFNGTAWVLFQATYDGSSIRIYQDAELVHTEALAFNITEDLAYIAGSFSGVSTGFSGYISNFKMYNVALSQDQLRTYYLRQDGNAVVKTDSFKVVGTDNNVNLQVDTTSATITVPIFKMNDGTRDRIDIAADRSWIHDEAGNAYMLVMNGEFHASDGTRSRVQSNATDTRLVSPDGTEILYVDNNGVNAPTVISTDDSTKVATTAFVHAHEAVGQWTRTATDLKPTNAGDTVTLDSSLYQPVYGDNTGLVLNIPFTEVGTDEEQYDKSGHSKNAAPDTGANPVVNATGGPYGGSVGVFDGSDDYYTCDRPITGTGSDFTYEAYFNPSVSSINGYIINHGATDHDTYLRYYNGKIEFHITFSDESTATVESGTLPISTWYHAVGTYDGTTVKLYINGELVDSEAISKTTDFDTGFYAFEIGGTNFVSTYFNGYVTDLKVYSRALHEDEIRVPYLREGLAVVKTDNFKIVGTDNNVHLEVTDDIFYYHDGTRARVEIDANKSKHTSPGGGVTLQINDAGIYTSGNIEAQSANSAKFYNCYDFFIQDATRERIKSDDNETELIGPDGSNTIIVDDTSARYNDNEITTHGSETEQIYTAAQLTALATAGTITVSGVLKISIKAAVSSNIDYLLETGSTLIIDICDGCTYTYTGSTDFIAGDGSLKIRNGVLIDSGSGTLFNINSTSDFQTQEIENCQIYGWDLGSMDASIFFMKNGAAIVNHSEPLKFTNLQVLKATGLGFGRLFSPAISDSIFEVQTGYANRATVPEILITNFSGEIPTNDSLINIRPSVNGNVRTTIASTLVGTAGGTLFDETETTDTFTAVADASVGATAITSVTDSSGVSRFNFTVGPTLYPYQQVVNSTFTTNTAYNGTYIISAVGVGWFEVAEIAFGSNETGSFLSSSVTLTDTATTLSDGDSIWMDTDGGTDYDNGSYVYNQQTNSVQVNAAWVATETGTWSTKSLVEDNRYVEVSSSGDSTPSQTFISAWANDNTTDTSVTGTGTWDPVLFGTTFAVAEMEGYKLLADGSFKVTGLHSERRSFSANMTLIKSSPTATYRFRWRKTTGLDQFPASESKHTISTASSSKTVTAPAKVALGDIFRLEVEQVSGSTDDFLVTDVMIS